MPIWKISHSSTVFTDPSEKASLAREITDWYVNTAKLPDYYVNVTFYKLPVEDFYTAGTSNADKVLIEIIHIARHQDPNNKARSKGMMDTFDGILRPYTLDRGLKLEYNIIDAPAWLWRINGIDPPESFGEGEEEKAEISRKRLAELELGVGGK
ncbi:unnamed protein product [Zymoseptoria tritici ST99CH_1A5]|uniref:Tautomerase cis-CaaD-like domain-containing protein n=2 Tax=Zymoseptoria tritici TaxID=1047171 RepID=F9XFZ0_ZYMTI|nr:uncharacterized protein MYCGRDRAFT_45115 [Zymoseptoria tritici IPO323]EGP86094.1 hypothetical protein MYCGRDRAFT_45115 [Zymoseptoria tritici IPO323]SMY26188.1 unnamed protein product [Zymoseptoria tritici ST99CH_1A5]